MEVIIREINDAYDSLERGTTNDPDSAVFAEEHIHSILNLISNKDVTDCIQKLVGDGRAHHPVALVCQEFNCCGRFEVRSLLRAARIRRFPSRRA